MGLSHEHAESKILEKIQIYILIRAELLFTFCLEIPCNTDEAKIPARRYFFLIHLFARDVEVMKKLEIEKTNITFIISVLKLNTKDYSS